MWPAPALNSPQYSLLHLEKIPETTGPLCCPWRHLATPDFAPSLPAVLTDLPETLHMLFPLPGRASPDPSPTTCPNSAQFPSIQPLGLRSDITSRKSPPLEPQLSCRSPCISPIDISCSSLPSFFPPFLPLPSLLPRSTYSMPALGIQGQAWALNRTHGVKITQMQMKNCGCDRRSKKRRTGLRGSGNGPWENDA